jgi:pimeloyl-ACP methyl ester carboxylesterase
MRTSALFFIIFLCISACGQPSKVTSPLHYSLTGTGSQTLVFVHGWCINGDYWNSQAEAFKDRYKILTLDLAGHGKSKVQRTEWTMQNYASDVVELLTQLKLDNVILIGHSMSGNINLLVYDKIPEKVIGFIGIDNLHELGKEQNDTAKAESEIFLKALETNFNGTAPMFANFLFSPTTDSIVRARVMNDIMAADTIMAAATLRSLFNESQKESVYSKRLKVPLVLINSDTFLVNDSLLSKNAGSGYKVFYVHGTGHYPMIEAPEEFNTKLREALERLVKK